MDRKYAGDLPSAKGVSVDVISSDPRTEVSITTPAVALVTKFACSSDNPRKRCTARRYRLGYAETLARQGVAVAIVGASSVARSGEHRGAVIASGNSRRLICFGVSSFSSRTMSVILRFYPIACMAFLEHTS